jgi:ABC-type amino acid transport substrate-binding protein
MSEAGPQIKLVLQVQAVTINNYQEYNMRTLRWDFPITIAVATVAIVMVFATVARIAATSPDHISIAYSKDSVPFHFSDENNQPAGIIIDLWHLWAKKTGIDIEFRVAEWDETLEMVASGAADVHAGLFFSAERDKFLDYGKTITKTDAHYFYHVGLPSIPTLSGLAAYRVGVLRGDFVEGYLKDRLPEGTVVPFPDYEAMMNALQDGNLRVFAADTPTALYHLDRNGLMSEFSFTSGKPLYHNDFFFAVREGNQALIEKINRRKLKLSYRRNRLPRLLLIAWDCAEILAHALSIYSPAPFMPACSKVMRIWWT